MKKKSLLIYFVFLAFGLFLMYFDFLKHHPDLKNAPKLLFKNELYLEVKKISFERNHLYLNDTLYNAGGISAYSRIYSAPMYTNSLKNIMPPFKVEKSANSDTLKIIKGKNQYYLLVTQEQNFVKEFSGNNAN